MDTSGPLLKAGELGKLMPKAAPLHVLIIHGVLWIFLLLCLP